MRWALKEVIKEEERTKTCGWGLLINFERERTCQYRQTAQEFVEWIQHGQKENWKSEQLQLYCRFKGKISWIRGGNQTECQKD